MSTIMNSSASLMSTLTISLLSIISLFELRICISDGLTGVAMSIMLLVTLNASTTTIGIMQITPIKNFLIVIVVLLLLQFHDFTPFSGNPNIALR